MATVSNVELPSAKFGRYRIQSRLGVGGMSEVFLAEAVDPLGQQVHVAVKLLKMGQSAVAFNEEAELMGHVHHPNLVEAVEIGEAFGRPFIAMEFLIGGDLRSLLGKLKSEESAVPRPIAFHIALETLKGLAYFHQLRDERGKPLKLVHGDIAPSNIFFSGNGAVKLGDYGVAQAARSGAPASTPIAKLPYASPEQTRGEKLTPASDLFSVGTVLYELLFGEHPFRAASDEKALVQAIRLAKWPTPNDADKTLLQILRRATSPELGTRFRSAGEFAGELLHYVLDRDLFIPPGKVSEWLEETLGLAF